MASTTSSSSPTEWYKGNYLISTSPNLLDAQAINAAFDSPEVYWAKAMPLDTLKKMLNKSLCFGLYELPQSTASLAGRASPTQIGLARLITDEVSFAWLTDVYVLPEYQKQSLGKWLIQCVNEVLTSWPELRRVMCMASSTGEEAKEFYSKMLGLSVFESGKGQHGLVVLNKTGPGSVAALHTDD
ncbi:acetyltransferase protein [Rutstroemia sp. NJR-2017a BBW]|nr:acetyltransferase protein [Rutstroemia sp. NJR-2017a BBW]